MNTTETLNPGRRIPMVTFDESFDWLTVVPETLRPGAESRGAHPTRFVYLSRLRTPLGPMLLGTRADSVCLLEFEERTRVETQLRRLERRLDCAFVPEATEVGTNLVRELNGYFAGELRTFRTPLEAPGTDFQRRVWNALREIPFGETRSYGEQARMIGAPDAVRAVARANGENRLAIVIPCHRIIGANGALTGYGGGLRRKRWLLDHERDVAHPASQAELF